MGTYRERERERKKRKRERADRDAVAPVSCVWVCARVCVSVRV